MVGKYTVGECNKRSVEQGREIVEKWKDEKRDRLGENAAVRWVSRKASYLGGEGGLDESGRSSTNHRGDV